MSPRPVSTRPTTSTTSLLSRFLSFFFFGLAWRCATTSDGEPFIRSDRDSDSTNPTTGSRSLEFAIPSQSPVPTPAFESRDIRLRSSVTPHGETS
ncbi:hypothetical protein B0H17DRAFT_1031580 [Mycena rosella]|uniref:Secreted protein n=1 Tax=Mycena rosella TaxID=1033263 RepID=A0AAD7MB60_MYCRO|nr:hypothetical protein B0H17DRAFT_1031580 [Mycena rosella]